MLIGLKVYKKKEVREKEKEKVAYRVKNREKRENKNKWMCFISLIGEVKEKEKENKKNRGRDEVSYVACEPPHPSQKLGGSHPLTREEPKN